MSERRRRSPPLRDVGNPPLQEGCPAPTKCSEQAGRTGERRGPPQAQKQSDSAHEARRNQPSEAPHKEKPNFCLGAPSGEARRPEPAPNLRRLPAAPLTGSLRPPLTAPQPPRAPAPTLVTEETPQLGEDQAHAWPRPPAGHPGLTQAAAAAAPSGRTRPAAAPGQRPARRRGGGGHTAPPRPRPTAARRQGPPQRPHGCRAASFRASSRTPTAGGLRGSGRGGSGGGSASPGRAARRSRAGWGPERPGKRAAPRGLRLFPGRG